MPRILSSQTRNLNREAWVWQAHLSPSASTAHPLKLLAGAVFWTVFLRRKLVAPSVSQVSEAILLQEATQHEEQCSHAPVVMKASAPLIHILQQLRVRPRLVAGKANSKARWKGLSKIFPAAINGARMRLQSSESQPWHHLLLSHVHGRVGVPWVLNPQPEL